MRFIADKQTIDDLNLLGKFKSNSVFSMFCKVKTRGGEQLLEEMFRQPMTDPDAINRRSAIIQYVESLEITLPLEPSVFGAAEEYLSMAAGPSLSFHSLFVLRKKLMEIFLKDEQFEILKTGLYATMGLLQQMRNFIKGVPDTGNSPWARQIEQFKQALLSRELDWLDKKKPEALSLLQFAKLDYLLRYRLQSQMEIILRNIYEWDLYIAVSDVARNKKFSYAQALPATAGMIQASALWHPALPKPVANPVNLHRETNLLFLTGANMAGKSTFMKSLGIVVYLAHMGFPVPARDLRFAVRNGLCSSINVSDNLGMGYSHFYAEVLRVKQVAEEVSRGSNMLVIFDELFKGTNVKDAFDATLAVTKAFAGYQNCFFVVSTHIVEVGKALQENGKVQFSYLPTEMRGPVPHYTYQLKEGISTDRQGMTIIENERILELLKV